MKLVFGLSVVKCFSAYDQKIAHVRLRKRANVLSMATRCQKLCIYRLNDVCLCVVCCTGKPHGLRTARKLRDHRRDQKWHDKDYKKSHLGTRWKSNPFGGASHAKGIVLEKVYVLNDYLRYGQNGDSLQSFGLHFVNEIRSAVTICF